MFTRALLIAAACLLPALAAAESARPRVELKCVSFGTGPMLECLVKVQRRDGAPLSNVQVTLGALMPSMPLAHTITPVKADATGNPGEYKGTLELQMAGVWKIDVDVSGTVRDKVARNLQVDDCDGKARCVAAPAVPAAAGNDAGKGHEHHHGKH